jgi:hypothetical protein
MIQTLLHHPRTIHAQPTHNPSTQATTVHARLARHPPRPITPAFLPPAACPPVPNQFGVPGVPSTMLTERPRGPTPSSPTTRLLARPACFPHLSHACSASVSSIRTPSQGPVRKRKSRMAMRRAKKTCNPATYLKGPDPAAPADGAGRGATPTLIASTLEMRQLQRPRLGGNNLQQKCRPPISLPPAPAHPWLSTLNL